MLTRDEIEDALAISQPLLEVSEFKGKFIIHGTFVLNDDVCDEGPYDRFNIGILVDPDYPAVAPMVCEFEDRLPADIDRHMFSNKNCCVGIFPAWKETNEDISIGAFVRGPVRDFFISQVCFEETETWPFGEYEHGAAGIAQACSEVFGKPLTSEEAKRYLVFASYQAPKGHITCPCGSGKVIRKCCGFAAWDSIRAKCSIENAKKLLRHMA